MLLPSRAVILNTIAAPTACLASAIALSPAVASPGIEASHWRQGSGRTEPALPRRVLLIDLNPILELPPQGVDAPPLEATVERSVAEQQNRFAPALEHSAQRENPLENMHGEKIPMSERLAPSGGLWPSSPQQKATTRNLPPLLPAAQRAFSPTTQQAPPAWNAPFPSLGQPRLDRQLRRYLAYLETVGQPDIVIVGGQGAAQGIDPRALQAALGDRGHSNLKVFNWGLSHSSAQTVEWLLTKLLTPEQLPKLVIWAEASPALNGDRPDSAFARIQASPGQRLLAQGLRPQIAAAERPSARRLSQILSNPVQPVLPEAVVALARSLQGRSQNASANQPLSQSEGTKQTGKVNDKVGKRLGVEVTDASPGSANAAQATIAQAAPILINDRSRILPILRPQAPLPVLPAASSSNGLVNPDSRDRDGGLGQPSASGFRLVNWCRQTNGPCPSGDHSDSSAAANQTAVPTWLRQTQAAQEKLRRTSPAPMNPAQPSSLRPAPPSAASLTARRSQTSVAAPMLTPLTLPSWPQNQRTAQFLQAIGFQPVDQRLAPGSASQLSARDRTRSFSLQGAQNRALHRLAQFGQQQGMAIAVVPLPISQQQANTERYRQATSFRTYLSVAAQMTQLSLIELPGNTVVWQDALFAQPDRLNRYGAAVLGWHIGQSMDQPLLEKLRSREGGK